ncbi:MAG: TldD/PmbA family protein [bacterium]
MDDSAFPGLTPELGTTVLSTALRKGGDMAELFVEERHSLSLRLEDGKIEDAVSGTDRGGSVRLIQGLSTVFGYVDAVDEVSLRALAGELSRSRTGKPVAVRSLAARPARSLQPSGHDPTTVDAAAKARLLRLADETARALSPEVRQVAAVYGESRQRVWIAGSHGSLATDDRTRVMMAVTVMAQRDGLVQTGRETLAHHGGFELFDRSAVTDLAAAAAKKALAMLDSRPAPAGRMPVVLANGFGGVLFHEACGHGLEADFILKKSSVWEGKKGQRVADDHVFAYDDGVALGMWGSAGCDDEGTPCERTTLIEAGVLTGYLTDRLRGGHLGLPLTGNGRRQDYRHLPYPRMTNTYFGTGGHTRDEIIADTPRALYAKTLSGGEVNPATGDFVFGVAEGYLIEKGRVTVPVRGATLIGNGLEVLRGLDAIADDLEVKAGTCGKNGQSVPVGSGQPTLRIRELTVGGTSL